MVLGENMVDFWAKSKDVLGKCWNEFGEPFVVERMWV